LQHSVKMHWLVTVVKQTKKSFTVVKLTKKSFTDVLTAYNVTGTLFVACHIYAPVENATPVRMPNWSKKKEVYA